MFFDSIISHIKYLLPINNFFFKEKTEYFFLGLGCWVINNFIALNNKITSYKKQKNFF